MPKKIVKKAGKKPKRAPKLKKPKKKMIKLSNKHPVGRAINARNKKLADVMKKMPK